MTVSMRIASPRSRVSDPLDVAATFSSAKVKYEMEQNTEWGSGQQTRVLCTTSATLPTVYGPIEG